MGAHKLHRLTDILRAEHAAILKHVEAARMAGLASVAAFESLRKSKALIITHLQKEERELYPPIFASGNLREIGGVFSAEMVRLSQLIIQFFEKHERTHGREPALAAELERIISLLYARIAREENVLYPAYDRLIAEPA